MNWQNLKFWISEMGSTTDASTNGRNDLAGKTTKYMAGGMAEYSTVGMVE